MVWLALAGAILTEVAGTLCLRMASQGTRLWIIPVVLGYSIAFSLLAVTLHLGMTIGVAYGIWSAVGVALTAVAGRILFDEPFTWVMGLGVVLIGGGVLLIEIGGSPA